MVHPRVRGLLHVGIGLWLSARCMAVRSGGSGVVGGSAPALVFGWDFPLTRFNKTESLDIHRRIPQNTRFNFFQENSLKQPTRALVRAKITALGTYVPPRLLTNADLEKMVETTDQWIVERTGISERHLVDQGVATSDLAVEAAKKALAMRGIEASDLDAIFVATVTPDMLFPSTACLVQHKLGAKKLWGVDLSAA